MGVRVKFFCLARVRVRVKFFSLARVRVKYYNKILQNVSVNS